MSSGGWFYERVTDAEAQDNDLPSLAAPWATEIRRGMVPPAGSEQEPGAGASPEALAAAGDDEDEEIPGE